MTNKYDAAVIGAGILGLAHAYTLAKRGLRVLVLERHARAQGASIRNFGMIWPMGQPDGRRYALAVRSREIWEDVLRQAGLWYAACGSLHLAYHDDEAAVLREFVDRAAGVRPCELLDPHRISQRYPSIVATRLQLGCFSPTEMTVDPRQVIAELPQYLERQWGVDFEYSNTVLGVEDGTLRTVRGPRYATRTVICTGIDYQELAPESFRTSGLFPCKLQMMRTQPYADFRVGTMLAAGLTLKHYAAFAACPTLPMMAARLDRTYPEFARHGIHVMVAQNGVGELVLGDTHEYGDAISIFDRPELDEWVLQYLATFFHAPAMRIAARWHGMYVKHASEPYVIAKPAPTILAVTGVGGAGMTLSFGLAEWAIQEWLGEET